MSNHGLGVNLSKKISQVLSASGGYDLSYSSSRIDSFVRHVLHGNYRQILSFFHFYLLFLLIFTLVVGISVNLNAQVSYNVDPSVLKDPRV